MKKILIGSLSLVIALAAYFGFSYFNKSENTAVLEKYGLDGLSVIEMVNALDSRTDEPAGLSVSITPTTLKLYDNDKEFDFDLPKDQFYVSFAPYINQTHPCTQHNLVFCRSELVNQVMHVTITKTDGTVLLDEDKTTMANGFIGLWLPKNIEGTLKVDYNNLTVTIPLTTNDTSDTCITTPLQLKAA